MNSKKDDVVMLEQTQTHDTELMKPIPRVGKVDYSGAYAKTDPREIALVKKLDRWIMPMLWGMYWLNYLGKSCLLTHKSRLSLTCMNHRSQCHCTGTS
jgi:hypothetical protein